MRGFIFGLAVLAGMALTILSLRPGGLRRQLRFAARRFRIMLVLGGIWVLGSLVIRLAFATGPVSDYAPLALAIVLGAVFLFAGRDPDLPGGSSSPRGPHS